MNLEWQPYLHVTWPVKVSQDEPDHALHVGEAKRTTTGDMRHLTLHQLTAVLATHYTDDK